MNKKIPLNKYIRLQRGFDLPRRVRKEGEVPVIASSGIIDSHSVAKVRGPGVIIGRSGSIGGGQYIREDYWPLNTTLWVKDFKGNNPLFVYYLLRSINFKRFNAGAGVPTLNRNHLSAIKIPDYNKSYQNEVASILSPYEDLIKNNNRRIELLEKSAQLLYKEWFVYLRFPGHEHTKIVDGVPVGWELVPIQELLSNHIGGGWGKEEPVDHEIEPAYVIRGTDISDIHSGNFENVGLRYHKERALKSRLLEEGDIIFEVSGGSVTQPVGRSLRISSEILNIFDNQLICASFCKRLTPINSDISHYLQRLIIEERDNGKLQVFQKQSASAIQNFNFAAFLDHKEILIPKDILLKEFVSMISKIEKQKIKLSRMNYSLMKARDLLLPRLMNGEIAV